jgi:tyrosyl-DNA phosphodiesterase 1
VEEIAQKIKEGKTADILSMNLDTVTLEQAQCVAELIDSGQINRGKRSLQSPEAGSSASKRQKCDSEVVTVESDEESTSQDVKDIHSIADKIDKSDCHYFLSSIEGIPETKKQQFSLSFSDILDPSLGALESSVQFNFMVELGWLLAQYCYHQFQ